MSTKTFDSLDLATDTKADKGLFASIASFFSAMRDGMEMAKRYQVLTERGMHPSEAAYAAVASIGPALKR